MWLFARDGFYSIVQKPEDRAKGLVSVRARRRDDLDKLADRFLNYGKQKPEIIQTFNADYPYRIVVEKAIMAALVFDIVLEINYSNFKNTQEDRHSVMMDIWSAARKLERPPFLRPTRVAEAALRTPDEIDFIESLVHQTAQDDDIQAEIILPRTPQERCGSWTYTGQKGHPFACALAIGHGGPHRSRTWIKKRAQTSLPFDGI